jgi:hypothetical protein
MIGLVKRSLGAAIPIALLTWASVGEAQEAKTPSGTIEIEEVELAYIFQGNIGGGKLHYGGETHDFKIGGIGVGGIGIADLKGTGDVYDLKRLEDFPGTYGEARMGFVVGTLGKGDLWLENPNGVRLHLKAEHEGVMLSAGADGIVIDMD